MSIFTTTHQLPKLDYAYDALEPYLDTATMKLHHSKHHQAYTDNMNKALKCLKDNGITSIHGLLQHIAREDAGLVAKHDWADVRTAIRNHAGGYVNHQIFFSNLSPEKLPLDLNSPVAKAITAQWSSLDAFKKDFLDAAAKVFGSGWAFLVYLPHTQKLAVVSTSNQDIPEFAPGFAGSDCVTLLALDVWEHVFASHLGLLSQVPKCPWKLS
jgi:Fe-Mn family superoxide dismutase